MAITSEDTLLKRTSLQLFGITAIAWLSLQVIVGAGSVWYGGRMFGGGAKAKRLWKYHRCAYESLMQLVEALNLSLQTLRLPALCRIFGHIIPWRGMVRLDH